MRTPHSLCVLLLAVACAPATRVIVKPSAAKPAPASDAATLIVSSSMGYKAVNFLDGDGKVLGQLSGRAYTTIKVPPGPVTLYMVPERQAVWGERVTGTVEAGKVYMLLVGMRWGGAMLTVLSPRTNAEVWKERKTWVDGIENQELDTAQLAGLTEDLGNTKELLAAVDSVMKGYDAAAMKDRTIEAADGFPEAP